VDIFKNSEKNILLKIKKSLKKGQVLVLPTDTVYGLVSDAKNEEAVKTIFKIKKRDLSKPIGIFVRDIKMAKRFAKIDQEKERFARRYWPGKTTFIFRRNQSENSSRTGLLSELVGTKDTIGIRIPDYKLIQELFKEIDFPLAQTSVNISKEPALLKIKDIIAQFKNQKIKPGLIIEAGDLDKSKPSTVVDLTTKEPKVLRQGDVIINETKPR